MTEGSFASYVPQEVVKQIKVREEKFGSSNKTVAEHEVIHGNTVWVLLRSGIDTPLNDHDRFVIDSNGSVRNTCNNRYAKEGVLGGDLMTSGYGYKLAGIESVSAPRDTAAYRKTEVQGFRPIPGITNFSVKAKDTWGMILEAQINIKVWSRDDLEDMDRIYFKPGFPALLEWGHSLYFNPDGSICKTPRPFISDEKFFAGGNYEDLDKEIFEARQKNCNQEAVFGYITNFSWSFNTDGSFDCTLNIVSKGSVLEGLTMSSAGNNPEEENEKKQDDKSWYARSDYHRVLKAINNRLEELKAKKVSGKVADVPLPDLSDLTRLDQMPGRSTIDETKRIVSVKNAIAVEANKGSLFYKSGIPKLEADIPVVSVRSGNVWFQPDLHFFYMTLRSLLHLINSIDGKRGGGIAFDTLSTHRYGHSEVTTSGIDMPSLNPLVAFKQFQIGGNGGFSVDGDKDDSFRKCKEAQEKGAKSDANGFIEDDSFVDSHHILNIWVNYNVFVLLVEEHIRNYGENYSIKNVLLEFLSKIQKSFGNVNNFILHNNHSVGGRYYTIVDTNCINKDDAPPQLNVSGLYNTVTQFAVHSDVSNDIVNEMCIAAQAPTPGLEGAENADECLVFWGENCNSRWKLKSRGGKKNSGKEEEEKKEQIENEQKTYENWVKKLKKFYKKFREENINAEKEGESLTSSTEKVLARLESRISEFQLDGERHYKTQVQKDILNKRKEGYLHMGIIPFKATLTMLGISRLTVGNTFRINNGVLPKKYDNWGYIITGIEHKIQNNQWFTTLTTNYYPVYPNEKFGANDPIVEGGGYKKKGQALDQKEKMTDDKNTAKAKRRAASTDLQDVCDYKTAFTECSGVDYGKNAYHGRCARFTYSWAAAYTQGKSALEGGAVYNSSKGIYEPATAAGGNANSKSYRDNLAALGYSEGTATTMTNSEIRSLTAGSTVNGVKVKEGDVLVFYNNEHQHTCFFDGKKWQSDTEQNQAGVYKSNGPYTVYLMSSPPKSSDWNCGVHA